MTLNLRTSLVAFLLAHLPPLPVEKLSLLPIEHINVEGRGTITIAVVNRIIPAINLLIRCARFVKGIVLNFIDDWDTIFAIVTSLDDHIAAVVHNSSWLVLMVTVD